MDVPHPVEPGAPFVRAGILVVLLAGLAAAATLVDVPDLQTVRAWIAGLGPGAPVLFTLGYALVVPAPLPKSVLSTAAGLAFGIPLGVVVVVVGGTAGAVLAFGLGRRLGRDAVARLARGRLDRVDAALERHGTAAALAVRLVPVLPFTVLNYACGVTAMRLRHYTVGTAIGIVPGSAALVVLGSLGARLSLWVPVLISLGLAAVTLAVTTVRLARRPPPRINTES